MGASKQRRILYRIILPFALLFAVTTSLSWVCSAYFTTRYLEQGLIQQMEQVANLISRSGYLLNAAVLSQLKGVVNGEIVVFSRKAKVLASTFTNSMDERLLENITAAIGEANKPGVGVNTNFQGTSYLTIYHPLVVPEHGGAILSIWKPTNEIESLKREIVLGMGGIALAGILAMTLAGYFIARSITAPVQELVKLTEAVAAGDLQQRVSIHSRDELGTLAISFNQMVERLLEFEKKLVESERLATAGQMAAGLAHEIRNPLTSIKMLAQVLHGRLKDQTENQKMLQSLVQEIDRLDRIIQDIIHRARPGELRLQWEDVNSAVVEVMRLVADSLASQKIELRQNLAPGLEKVLLDREKFKQVLWNLLLNAKEAMPRGGHLAVSTRVVNSGEVEITVEDSGRGIAEANADRLLQPFFTTKPEGMGLGLAISRQIVESHGGRLLVENRAEGGARASILLPSGTTAKASKKGNHGKDSGG